MLTGRLKSLVAELRGLVRVKNKAGVQGDYRAICSVLSPLCQFKSPLTLLYFSAFKSSSLIALFPLPLGYYPGLTPSGSLLVSPQTLAVGHAQVFLALSSPLYSRFILLENFLSRSKCIAHFPTTFPPYTFVGFFFVSPQFFLLLFSHSRPHSPFLIS